MSAGEVTPEIHRQTGEALDHWLQGIDRAVSVPDSFIAGAVPTLADICFACEMVLLANERARGAELDALGLAPLTGEALGKKFPHALRHYDRLCAHPAFAPLKIVAFLTVQATLGAMIGVVAWAVWATPPNDYRGR